VITGDLVNNRENVSQIAEFKMITTMISSEITVHYKPGNHEVANNPTKQSLDAYITTFGYDRFSFKNKGSLIIEFNSSLIKADFIKPEKRHYQWLNKQIWKK